MAKSGKRKLVTNLKKELRRREGKMRRAMTGATPGRKKKLKFAMKRLDTAYRAISMVFDEKSCLGFDDSNCTYND